MNTKHTPGSLHATAVLQGRIVGDETATEFDKLFLHGSNCTVATVYRPQDARRLATCWNMHDELVDALHRLTVVAERRDTMLSDPVYVLDAKQDLQQAVREARAVLAKIEGGAK